MPGREKWYAGDSDGRVVVIEGMLETPLRHYVRHSPTGFSWGYGGSGPSDLARCLLIDALEEKARCATCRGVGAIVSVDGEDLSFAAAQAAGIDPTQETTYGCNHCDDGLVVEAAMYQQFKFDVVARMTMDQPWSMPRSQILAWHEAYAKEGERS